MVAHETFNLTAETLSQSNDFRLFRYCCDALAVENVEGIVPDISEEAFRPTVSGNGHMNVATLEHVENDASNDLAIFFDAHAGHWRDEANAAFFRDELNHTIISDDQLRSPVRVLISEIDKDKLTVQRHD